MTLSQVETAISEKVRHALVGTKFENVTIIFEEVTQSLVRPSIKIAVNKLISAQFNSSCKKKTFNINVSFFAEDLYKAKADNSKIQELLELELLGDIYFEDIYVPVSELNTELKDGNLIISFELYVIELLSENETTDNMENLEFKEEVND